MADRATLQTWHDQAEAAYNALCTGRMRVEVDSPDGKVVYTPTNKANLRAYLAELKLQLGLPPLPQPRRNATVFT